MIVILYHSVSVQMMILLCVNSSSFFNYSESTAAAIKTCRPMCGLTG